MSINASESNSGSGPLFQMTGNMYSAQNQTITTNNINHTPANGGSSFGVVSTNHPKDTHKAPNATKRGERGNVRSQRDNGKNDQ